MAYPKKRMKRNKNKMEPSVTSLFYEMPTGTGAGVSRFIDLSADLSRLNRKLMRQGMQYVVAGVTVTDDVNVTSALDVSISTAGNTWVTQNAWTKGRALWDEMNQEVLDDNPSVQGKWADYKVGLTENMASANTISALDGSASALPGGYEWNKSTYVVPQHDVDAAGNVKPADQFTACLVGPDDLPNFVFSLVKAYEDSRATVQNITPNVPAALPNSFYLKLTDGYEWNKSTYVVPQHDVDAAGNVKPADQFTACLVGPDDLPNFVFSLVKAYEDSRATVQNITPNVPAALPNSFYLKLTDDGSQDPELATVIIDQNDQPPYSPNAGAYPGGAAFTVGGATTRVCRGVKNDFTPTLQLGGFTAECGLIRIDAVRSAGSDNCRVQIHLVPGNYRGVMAIPMGQ